jgi:hypothetical protein
MTGFRKYDHLERCEHPDVADIGFGTVHVFPKIDGTNASVWCEDGVVQCGSRTRVLSAEQDNAGFHAWVNSDDPVAVLLRALAKSLPFLTFYGEWLVPHTLKTYREDAWRQFYIFDVYDRAAGRYLPFAEYVGVLEAAGQNIIRPLAIIENPSENQLVKLRDATNTYLIADEKGVGEGIVLKNYAWRNKHGRQPWAKMVRNEFKDASRGLFGGVKLTPGEKQVEQDIVDAFCTEAFIRKEFAKVVLMVADDVGVVIDETDRHIGAPGQLSLTHAQFVAEFRHKIIPRFLGTFYLELVRESMRDIVKKFKNPIVDFSKLHKLMTIKAKRVLSEVF